MELLPEELVYKITYMIPDQYLINWRIAYKRVDRLCTNPVFWRQKIDFICAHRSRPLVNKSVSVLVNLYNGIKKRGYLHGTGYNGKGNLGVGHTGEINIPPTAGLSKLDNIVQISCGNDCTAFLTDQGELYTFGNNDNGELGHGDKISRSIPVKVDNLPRIKQVSCGSHHMACITDQGQVYTWGTNYEGQLGIGDNTECEVLTPTKIWGFTNVIQISCGGEHTAFITEENNIYVFGSGMKGQLGLGHCGGEFVPAQISEFNNVKQVSCGERHTAFITKEGNVYIFGSGLTPCIIRKPTIVPNFTDIIKICCGDQYIIFITKNRMVYGLGYNDSGQLGIGDTEPRNEPTLISIGGSYPSSVSCGSNHTAFVITTSGKGEVYVCGNNCWCPLGFDNGEENVLIPRLIPDFTDIIQVACGGNFTVFIKAEDLS